MFLLLSFVFCARPFSVFSLRFAICFTLVKRTMLCTNLVCAALCLFGGFVVPCMCCPPGRRGIVLFLCSCWCFSLSSWFLLRSSLCLGGPCCFCCCLPSFGLVPFSVLFAFPPPRVVSFGALVQLVPWRAGASLWVSGCSCDGLVALPSCWECG